LRHRLTKRAQAGFHGARRRGAIHFQHDQLPEIHQALIEQQIEGGDIRGRDDGDPVILAARVDLLVAGRCVRVQPEEIADIAAGDRITSDDNVAYTLHFYANTHREALRAKARQALNAGIALFVTEWGTCSADGNGSIDEGETRTWLAFLRDNGISWANWALNDKSEACSAVQPSGGSVGPWRDDQLTPSGRLVKGAIP